MSSAPAFASTPRMGHAAVTAANSNLDGSGTVATILAAGSAGTKIERIFAKARGTTTAGMLRFFVWDGASTYRLVAEIPVAAATPSGTVSAWEGSIDFSTPDKLLHIPSGFSLVASTHNAENFNAFAFGGDY